MNVERILQGRDELIDYLTKDCGYEEISYEDSKYEYKILDVLNKRLLAICECIDQKQIRELKRYFLIDRSITHCAFYFNGKIIFYRSYGDIKYFTYSKLTKNNISKKDKVEKIGNDIDVLFNLKDVSRDFYEEFKNKRDILVKHIENKIDNVNKYLISQKIFDRIFFIYFLCHKNLIKFSDNNESLRGESFFNNLLDNGNFIQNLYKSFECFNNPKESLQINSRKILIPYLNGGLFRIENDEQNLKTSLGKKDWKDIFDFLNSYHWIIEDDVEDIDDDEKVLTPEILGHVYERSVIEWEKIGFNTAVDKSLGILDDKNKKESERKLRGVYYTPEDITEYVCQNTIYPYILTRLPKRYEDKFDLITNGNKKDLRDALILLDKITILDPACGSGAFLIKAADTIFRLKSSIFSRLGIDFVHYELKLNIIINNVFGVDILKGAIEITKLRLWLWLIASYSEEQKIQALPNIEYNFRVGNSLVGWMNEDIHPTLSIPLTSDIEFLMKGLIANASTNEREKFEKIKNFLSFKKKLSYFAEAYSLLNMIYKNARGKRALDLKEIIETIRDSIYKSINTAYLKYINEKIKPGHDIKKIPINLESFKGTYPFHWNIDFFDQKNGFSIIIGNPPYGAKISDIEKKILDITFTDSKLFQNSALLFMELSKKLSNNGSIGLIVPKSLAFSQKWKLGRNLIKNHLVSIRDVSKAFPEVKLEQVIIILKMDQTFDYYTAISYNKESSKVKKDMIDKTDALILNGNQQNLEIFKLMKKSKMTLGNISTTERGLPIQKQLTSKNSNFKTLRGDHITRFSYHTNEYLPNSILSKYHDKIIKLKSPKIVSQRIVAHITKPNDRIEIISAFDKEGLVSVDTVENTFITDANFSYEFIVCLLNSKLISWYCYNFIFSNAIRTMDLDEYYINKIPLPFSNVDNNFFKMKLEQIYKALHNQDEDNLLKVKDKLDDAIYRLYGLNQNQINFIEKI